MILSSVIIGGYVCVLIASHFLRNYDNRSQCGIRLASYCTSNNPCVLYHKCVPVQGGLPRTHDVKGKVCVVALTMVPISVVLCQSVLAGLLRHLC